MKNFFWHTVAWKTKIVKLPWHLIFMFQPCALAATINYSKTKNSALICRFLIVSLLRPIAYRLSIKKYRYGFSFYFLRIFMTSVKNIQRHKCSILITAIFEFSTTIRTMKLWANTKMTSSWFCNVNWDSGDCLIMSVLFSLHCQRPSVVHQCSFARESKFANGSIQSRWRCCLWVQRWFCLGPLSFYSGLFLQR